MSAPLLVCFAVPQEAKPFQKLVRGRNDVRVLLTGMGARNAEDALRRALEKERFSHVISSGFAGALDPTLRIGDVVFLTIHPDWDAKLVALGARPVVFFSTDTVITKSVQKAELRRKTNAHAVDMESVAITQACAKAGVYHSTVRVISDRADENLPLDFNALMTREQKLSPGRLAWQILKSPQKIPALMRLGKNSAFAAERLAHALGRII